MFVIIFYTHYKIVNYILKYMNLNLDLIDPLTKLMEKRDDGSPNDQVESPERNELVLHGTYDIQCKGFEHESSK